MPDVPACFFLIHRVSYFRNFLELCKNVIREFKQLLLSKTI